MVGDQCRERTLDVYMYHSGRMYPCDRPIPGWWLSSAGTPSPRVSLSDLRRLLKVISYGDPTSKGRELVSALNSSIAQHCDL